jgi:acetylornithine deacetylase
VPTSDTAGDIAAAAEREAPAALDFLRDLVRLTRQGEDAIQDRIAAALAELGCRIEELRYRPADVPLVEEFAADHAVPPRERRSVIGILPGTDTGDDSSTGRSLMLFAHPDPEPLAGLEAWQHDPFAATVEDGRLYGWGAADDLAGIAMMVQGLRVALAAGIRPGGTLTLASTPSKQHARGVGAVLHHGYRADAAVYMHPAESGVGMQEIKAFAPGQLEFRITVAGRLPDTQEPAHTAFAHLAVNPLDKAAIVCDALRALDRSRGERVHHPALQVAIGRSTNLQISTIRCGDPERLSRLDRRCVIGCALSFPPPEKLQAVMQEVEQAVQRAAANDPWLSNHPPQIEWIAGVGAAETAADDPLYRLVAGAVTAATGLVPKVNPLHTASDIRNPVIQKGMPTVGLGPLCGSLTMAGARDEWVDIADFQRAVRVTASIIAGWCGSASPR